MPIFDAYCFLVPVMTSNPLPHSFKRKVNPYRAMSSGLLKKCFFRQKWYSDIDRRVWFSAGLISYWFDISFKSIARQASSLSLVWAYLILKFSYQDWSFRLWVAQSISILTWVKHTMDIVDVKSRISSSFCSKLFVLVFFFSHWSLDGCCIHMYVRRLQMNVRKKIHKNGSLWRFSPPPLPTMCCWWEFFI